MQQSRGLAVQLSLKIKLSVLRLIYARKFAKDLDLYMTVVLTISLSIDRLLFFSLL